MPSSMQPSVSRPLARDAELTVERLHSETLVYDHLRHRVHCLNETLTFIWDQCNGEATVEEIAARLPQLSNLPPDPAIVIAALRQLQKIHLLTAELSDVTSQPRLSRRELARKYGPLGLAAALLPAVTSVIAPTPSMAASGDNHDDKDKDKDKDQDKKHANGKD